MASKAPPPSSATPAGVPPGGNAKFIVIAVLLLGAIGGLVFWKLSQKPTETVTIVQDAGPPLPPPTSTREDDIPLPPPVEDAGPDGGKKTVVAAGNLGTQCDAKKCGGASSSELENALAFRAKQAHRCYDQALAQDSSLKGRVSIAVRIGANGSVCSAGVASNELSSPGVANCVAGYFRSGVFPSPRGGCADVSVPINCVPRQ